MTKKRIYTKKPFWLLILLLIIAYPLYLLLAPSQGFYYKETQKFIEIGDVNATNLFLYTFDNAKKCNEIIASNSAYLACQKKISKEIYNKVPHLTDLKQSNSTYFIRLQNDQTIEKLFLSGKLNSIDVPTETNLQICNSDKKCKRTVDMIKQQQKVIALLKGEKKYLPDGYNTLYEKSKSFYLQGNNEPKYHFLNDFGSEFEMIFPVKDKKGHIIGAIVRLHGD